MAKSKVATAYVQVMPSMEGVAPKVRSYFSGAGDSSGSAFGSNLIGKIKGLIAAVGIGKMLTDSIMAGADLQQSLGGVETLFKDSADIVIKNAEQAYKNAGMSANQYMETVTGFSASLLQGLSGDTEKAASVADMALADMSDNANKMGTSMESIQNAYQGFAKQNYTMLDNLKLGYGGTKTEMERLLADAQKLTGVKYDISNLADVYEAIHVIQEEMGITGTTAKEAASTLSGSFASMKAAFSDLLANLALGRDIEQPLQALMETVSTFLIGNLIPTIGNILMGLPTIISGALSMAIQGLNLVADNAETIVRMGIDLVTSIGSAIITALPNLTEAAANVAMEIVDEIGQGLAEKIPELSIVFENLETVVVTLTAAMVAYKAATAISGAIDALKAATEGQTIAQTILNAVMNANPFVLVATLVAGLAAAIITLWNTNEGFRSAVTSAWETVKSTVSAVVDALVSFFTGTVPNAINTLVSGIKSIPSKISSIFSGFSWGEIGSNIISGIAKGISSGVSAIINAAKQAAKAALDAAKKFLGIASPSKVMRDQVGKFIPSGLAVGIENNTKPLTDAMHDLSDLTTDTLKTELSLDHSAPVVTAPSFSGGSPNVTINVYAAEGQDVEELAEIIMSRFYYAVERKGAALT